MTETIRVTKAQVLSDLEFAICSPDLEKHCGDYQPTLNWYLNIWQHIELKLKSSLLPEYFVSTRLGLYFEWLWQLALNAHPEYRVLATNLQVNDGSRTLGSFDFLIEHLPSGQVEHWELACKFYLALKWQQQWLWLGPNLNDYWPLKKAKLLNHQIRLSNTPAAKERLAEFNIPYPLHKRIIVKGKVFMPEGEPNPSCYWQTYQRWQLSERQGTIQTKDAWLRTQPSSSEKLNLEAEPKQPTMLLFEQRQQFVVPNDWPQRAQKKAAKILC